MGLFFLTSSRSGVRIPQLPHKTSKKFEVFFMSKNLRTLLQKSIKNSFRIKNRMFLDFFNSKISAFTITYFLTKKGRVNKVVSKLTFRVMLQHQSLELI